MAENRKGKDKRYYFNRLQMLLLGVGFTIASIIIFLLGMVVGKAIEERKIAKAEEPLMKIPVKPGQTTGSSAAGSQSKEELTFYDTLTKAPVAGPPGEDKPKPRAQENTTKSDSKEKSRRAGDTAPQTARLAPEKSAEKKGARKEKPPERLAAVKTAEKDKAQEQSRPARAETAESSKEPAQWTVQVNAFPDERAAKSWVDRLKNKGYNAYMTEMQNNGKTWYRVRVGRYSSREEAEKVEEVLKSKENLPSAFATGKLDG
jgi:cell division septation protein DedD